MKYVKVIFPLCILVCIHSYSLIQASDKLIVEEPGIGYAENGQEYSVMELIGDDFTDISNEVEPTLNYHDYTENSSEAGDDENYVFYADFFAEEGTAEKAVSDQPADEIDRIEFLITDWQGSQYEFLADQHYAFAAYENADLEYIEWNAHTLVDGIETPSFQLRNGETIYLRMQNNGEFVFVRSVLPNGIYDLTITDGDGNIFASAVVTITDTSTPVTELQFGETVEFELSTKETRVFSVDFKNQENESDKLYPVYLSSESGDYTVQNLWDDNEWITSSVGSMVYVQAGKNERYPFNVSAEGKAFFLIKSMDEGVVSGAIRITRPSELTKIEETEFAQVISYNDVLHDVAYELLDSFALTLLYEDGSTETLRKWTKSSHRNCYYAYTASGKPIYIYLKDENMQKIALPSASNLPETGTYYWSVEYQFDGEEEPQVLSTQNVELEWGIEENNLVEEPVTISMEGGHTVLFSGNITDSMYLNTTVSGEDNTAASLESRIYRLEEGRWVLNQDTVYWNGDDQYTLLEAGEYIVFLNALEKNDVTLLLEEYKPITEMSIADQMPEELTVTQLLSNPGKYLPDENISVSITYDDGTSEEVSEWEIKQETYVAATRYGKEITLKLDDNTDETQVFWGEGRVPVPGTYCWVASIDEVTASSGEHMIIDDVDTVISLGEETELGNRGKFVASFSIEEKGMYQIWLSFETENDETASVYCLSNGMFNEIKTWVFEDGKIMPVSLEEGQYYIALSDELQLPGTVLIGKRESVSAVAFTGLDEVNAYESLDYFSSDVKTEPSLKGLTIEITYEGGSGETISLAANDYYLRLSNGEILSFGVVNLDGDEKPVLVKEYGAQPYYELSEKLRLGTYAMVAILDGEAWLDSFIPYTVKLDQESGLLEVPDSYAIPDEEGLSAIQISEDNPQSFIKIEVEKTGKYVMFSDADDELDTIASLYKYDEDSELLKPVASDDDSGNGYNFKVVYNLEKGSTYYLECKTYDDETAEFSVYLREKTITVSDGWEELTYEAADLPDTIMLSVVADTSMDTGLLYQWYEMDDEGKYALIESAVEKTLVIDPPKSGIYYCEVTDGNETEQIHKEVFIDNHLQINGASVVCADENGNASIRVEATAQKGELQYSWEERKYDSENDDYYLVPVQGESNNLSLSGITDTKSYRVIVTDIYGNSHSRWIDVYRNHEWQVERTDAATCTHTGLKILKCSNCGNEKEEIIPATGHSFGSWITTTPATIQSEGIQTRTCSVCKVTETKTIPRLLNNGSGTSGSGSSGSGTSGTGASGTSTAGEQSVGPAPAIETPVTVTEQITVPKKPTLKKLDAAANKITVKWSHFKHTTKKTKAIWKKIKKVQVQCATDKAFTNIVKTSMVGKSKTTATVKGLKKNTTYYVRIRYFDGIGYSKWSSAKKIKTKKK